MKPQEKWTSFFSAKAPVKKVMLKSRCKTTKNYKYSTVVTMWLLPVSTVKC